MPPTGSPRGIFFKHFHSILLLCGQVIAHDTVHTNQPPSQIDLTHDAHQRVLCMVEQDAHREFLFRGDFHLHGFGLRMVCLNNVFTRLLQKAVRSVEVKTFGSMSSGLNTTGTLNISGSLILNSEGAIQMRLMVFILDDLERSISTLSGSVAPTPPIVISAAVNAISLVVMFMAAMPFATAVMFSEIAIMIQSKLYKPCSGYINPNFSTLLEYLFVACKKRKRQQASLLAAFADCDRKYVPNNVYGSYLRVMVALMEITSKNYQRILEFKLSNHAGRLSPSDTDIISQSPKNDKGENSDYYTDKKKVDRLQQPYQRAFTPEEIQKIVTAYQSGKASYELGAEFNCSKTTIVKLLKQQGVPLRKSGRTRAKVDDKKVIRMYKEMHTIKEISKNLNVDTQVISRCLKENGVKLRSRWDYPEK